MANDNNRDLLVVIFAIQLGFIDADHFVDAARSWIASQDKPLVDVLVEKGQITREDRKLLIQLVDRHIEQNGSIDNSIQEITKHLAPSDFVSELSIEDLRNLLPETWIETIDRVATQPVGPQNNQGTNKGTNDVSGRFQVKRDLAKGGLGKVSVAHDQELDREVALKEILSRHANRKDSQLRFITEAKVTGSLEHPGIVPIYALGYFEDGRPYYAMRLIRGKSLSERIKEEQIAEQGSSSYLRAIRPLVNHLIDVCNTIAYAHSRGVLHRDLKPSNIMLGKYGETLVVDWGLAKAGESADVDPMQSELPMAELMEPGSQPTEGGSILGTPSYMSPEQANGRVDLIDSRSDIFSLGATLYHILTGHAPYEGSSREDILDRARHSRFKQPRELHRHVPAELQAICLKAMSKEQTDRYATAKDLADDLDRWAAGEPVKALPEGTIKTGLRLSRRHQGALVSGLLMSMLGMAGMTWLYREAGKASIAAESARKEESEARKQAVQSREFASSVIANFIAEIGDDTLAQIPGFDEKRIEILERALQEIDEYLQRKPNDSFFQLEKGNILLRIGNIFRTQQKYEEAIQRLAEIPRIIDSVPESIRTAAQKDRDDWDALSVDSHYYLAETYLVMFQGQHEFGSEALVWSEKNSTLAKAYQERNKDFPEGAIGYARSLNLHGRVLIQREEFDAAEKPLDASIQVLEPWVINLLEAGSAKKDNEDVAWRNVLLIKIEAYSLLIETLQAQGKFDEARDKLKRAIELNGYLLRTETGKRDGRNFESQFEEKRQELKVRDSSN
jgi:eukaryotic-like serine/threonine-protein kinase